MLVTGASQGIGRALCRRGREARLQGAGRGAVAARCSTNSPPEVRAAGGTIETVAADVTKPEDRQAMVDAAMQHFGGLDVLVNNAGIGATGHFMDSDPEILRKIFETNFFGLTETTRVFLPLLKQGTHAGDREHLVGGRQAGVAGAVAVLVQQVRGGRVQRGDPGRAGEGRHRRDRRQPRPDADELLEEHAGAEGQAADGPPARHDERGGRGGDAAAIEKGKTEVTLTLKGKLLVLVNRFFPWFVDWKAKKTVRKLFADEIAERKRKRDQQSVTQLPK